MKDFFCFLHIFRTLRLRLEGTHARKNPNKFGFFLA